MDSMATVPTDNSNLANIGCGTGEFVNINGMTNIGAGVSEMKEVKLNIFIVYV